MLKFGEKPFLWDASRLRMAQNCMYQYYLAYVKKPKPKYIMNASMAMGIFLHRMMENFYKNKKGSKKQGYLIMNNEPKYKSSESFANTARGRWKMFVCKDNKIDGREIRWRDDSEKWILANELREICRNLYRSYLGKEEPVFVEYPFEFLFDGIVFRGRIDEIRRNFVVRDHKYKRGAIEKLALDRDPQFTIYALAYSILTKRENFADLLKANSIFEDTIKKDFRIEYHHFNPKEYKDGKYLLRNPEIKETFRSDRDLGELMNVIWKYTEDIKKGNYIKNIGGQCGYCLYTKACEGDFGEKYEGKDVILFNRNEVRFSGPRQGRFKFK